MVATTLQALSGSFSGLSARLGHSSTAVPPVGHFSNSSLAAFEQLIADYLPLDQAQQVRRAYYYSEQAHYGQTRRSGEPYVSHPLAVASILARMHMDAQSLMAALLHDVIEDTGVNKEDIGAQFGEEVAELVDGVSKLTHVEFDSVELRQAENFQKMTLAMAKDIRVILVKLADRLHNMRTLGVLNREKVKRIAGETLDIYAPIAMRLGMNEVRMEFEDLGLKALYPMRARRLEAARKAASGNRKQLVDQIKDQLTQTLAREGLAATVIGREKHLFSIYSKMKAKRKSFSEVMDIFAFRLIVDSVDDCYRALGMVHSLYKPVPGEFKDYIAIPKANGYQSLHTVLKGMHGVPIEIQIRTHEMEDMANNGIAAHWLYKTEEAGVSISHTRAREWVQGLLEMQQRAGDSLEFIENVKIDLFPDEVYVFTPRGDILELPKGACAIDFAYAVHSDIGDRCVAARVSNQLVPLSEPLESGATVEIVTSPSGRPSPSWLNWVVTARARTHIRHFLKDQRREDSLALGRNLLDRALMAHDTRLSAIDQDMMSAALAALGKADIETLLVDVALGNTLPHIAIAHMISQQEGSILHGEGATLGIRGTEGVGVTYAKCCCPLPGDAIQGYLGQEKGLMVHRDNCRNLIELRDQPDRLISLHWDDAIDRTYPIGLRVQVENRRGMIAVLATRLSSMGLNIERIATQNKDVQVTFVDLELQVSSRTHLARVMKRLRTIEGVLKVFRSGRR
ncbi:MAG: bifunctional (p)ppGpp synthetase/guanosine-3',5'-bis(diphosphate) 3'-pyrophosphohydrolase [Gammaproteobacteria bacterium]|nr:bifunctional (p)ppGpp synthetase/guanosine-3',5'-bis(diphosphate) 3'-pyrophosphohydrolase [Gammaproteobacteria bacterium]